MRWFKFHKHTWINNPLKKGYEACAHCEAERKKTDGNQ